MSGDTLARLSAAIAERYRVERELGAGGMATVHLAHDLKHQRDVAIKVLHPDLGAALGGERFLSEIRTTARLQHPHILPLLDSGEADSLLYYVMPLVTGETLRARLERERLLPIADAVRIASEVASALDYAHRQGVIHRDIKPENILLHDGQALVADFGIALAVQQAGGSRMTQTGLSLGTPHYMSPEQAMGEKTIDARADVYALGAVLYEMLAGEPPFTGGSVQAIVAKVLTERPTSIRTLRDTVPPHVESAVLTALAKLPADRFESAKAFHDALRDAGHATGRATTAMPAASRHAPGGWRPTTAGLAALCAVAAALAAWGWLRPGTSDRTVSRFAVNLWDDDFDMSVRGTDGRIRGHRVAIAPDGSSLVFRGGATDSARLYRKLRDERTATPMAGTEGGMSPFFSPDGAWVGFATQSGDLRKVPAAGGGAITLAKIAGNGQRTGVWMDDGRILFVDEENNLRQITADGSAATTLRNFGSGIAFRLWPLPGSRGVLINACRPPCTTHPVYVHEFGRDSLRQLLDDAAGAWYSPSGHLVYAGREGGLFAIAFDPEGLETTGGAFPVIDGVKPEEFTISASGDALYGTGTSALGVRELVWVSRGGAVEPVDPEWRALFDYPALSPDGSRVAVTLREADGNANIWVKRFGGGRQKLTLGTLTSWRPSWIGDGTSLMYAQLDQIDTTASNGDLWRSRADGSAEPERVLDVPKGIWEGEMSRDGQWIVYRVNDRGVDANVYARRVSGDTTTVPIVRSGAGERTVALSPDGRWLAYSSNEAGDYEVYIVSFPDASSRQLVSRSGGTGPRWRADGRELFFLGGADMMAVPIAGGPRLTVGEPVRLFDASSFDRNTNRQTYDVTADGRRFLMIRPLKSRVDADLVYVQNLAAEIRHKLTR
jgi:Tol biopolymer transport system component